MNTDKNLKHAFENYKKVIKKFYPSRKEPTLEEMKKLFSKKTNLTIGKSTLIEHFKNPVYTIVTDLVTEKKYLYVPRFSSKNEELNLVSGITSLGLFDSDNVYTGQLDPNNTGIREPITIDPTTEPPAEDGTNEVTAKSTDLIPGVIYDTIFGNLEIVSIDENKMIVKDRNSIELEITVEDFRSLNPLALETNGIPTNTAVQDGQNLINQYRVLFKTLQNDGSVREWCVSVETEAELDKEIEDIKQRADFIEITNIMKPEEQGEDIEDMNAEEEVPVEEEPTEEEFPPTRGFSAEDEGVPEFGEAEVETEIEEEPIPEEIQTEESSEEEETEETEEIVEAPGGQLVGRTL